MLRIVLPQWQDNAGMYENRVKDFVDDITIKGVGLYHNNENAFNNKMLLFYKVGQVVRILPTCAENWGAMLLDF